MTVQTNLEIAQKMQERFEFYALALTFTILGLSIQTAKFGTCVTADAFEILGWVFLFISGVVGLSRLEQIPIAYKYIARIYGLKSELENFKQAPKNTLVQDKKDSFRISEVIDNRQTLIDSANLKLAEIEKWTLIKYQAQKWSFTAGLLFLLLARSWEPTTRIILSIWPVATVD